VLAYNAMFPQMSETYIEDELEALAEHGADLAFVRAAIPPSEPPVDRPVYMGLPAALREYEPDLLFLHWLTWADQQLEAIEATGLPFAVRVHSFDFDVDVAERVASSPSCIGMWAYPHHAAKIRGARALPPLFTSVNRLLPPAATRDLVLSVSAGLPKKDWGLLLDALARVEGAEPVIIMATTIEQERLPAEITSMAQRYPNPPAVRVDVPRGEVFQALARAAVLVYTLEPGRHFGNPMSVVEAMCAGTSVILPDRPEARRFAGPSARFYATADDIVGHVKDILAGGPAIEAEQATNRSFGMRSFADPALRQRFYSEVVESLDAWRASAPSRPS
jgi:glycosyltransferase involved in cell wall biosynthesis